MEELNARVNKVMSNGFDLKKALVRINRTQDELNSLRDKVGEFGVVPKSIHDKQLIGYLLDGLTVDQAARRCKLFYEIKVNNPKLFLNRDPESKEIQQCLRSQNCFFLPITPEGKMVIFLSLIDLKPSSWHFDESAKTCIMVCEEGICRNGPAKGVDFLVDMKGLTLSHLTRPSLKTAVCMIKFAFYACPAFIKKVHVLNTPSFFDIIIKLFLKPFMNRELKDLLFLHHPNMNWEEFYEKHIPKSCLPSDYGGDLESIELLQQSQCKTFISCKPYFLAECEQVLSVQRK